MCCLCAGILSLCKYLSLQLSGVQAAERLLGSSQKARPAAISRCVYMRGGLGHRSVRGRGDAAPGMPYILFMAF